MSGENEIKEEQETVTAEAPENTESEAAKEAPKKEEKKSRKHNKEIEALKASLEEEKDKYLRMMAEYDNFRKRAQKEREAAYANAYADALTEILPIIDNLERAVGCTGDKLEEGLKMTLNQFTETLKKLGVEEIPAEPGEQFDPNIHNAVMHVEDESFGENTITQLFAKGYRKNDTVIRHPMVMVAN